MHYHALGRTNFNVSLLSYGTGGQSQFGQRKGLEQQGQNKLIRRCLDLGINLFDTHEMYGRSEEILGEALRGVPRDSYYLVTKWKYDKDDVIENDPEQLARSLDNSLRRLQTEYVDSFLFHGLMVEHYDTVVTRFIPVMERLQQQGKIRSKGFSVRFIDDPTHSIALHALKHDPKIWDAIMLKCGILNQYAAKEILPLAQEHNVGILNMASVRIRLPDPKLLEQTIAEWKEKGYISEDSLPEKNPLGWLVHDEVDSVISAAYKFAADHPAISTVISGTSSIAHLESNIDAMQNPSLLEADTRRLIQLFSYIAEYA